MTISRHRRVGAFGAAGLCLAGLLGAATIPGATAARPTPAAAGRVIATIRVGTDVGAVAVDPGLHLAYVARAQTVAGHEFPAAVLVVIDLRTHRVIRQLVVGHDTISGLAVDPRTHRIYVLLGGYNNGDAGPEGVQVVSGPRGRVIRHLEPGSGAVGMAIAPGLRRGWVATERAGVGAIDLGSERKTGAFAAALFPDAVAWDPGTRHLIVVSGDGARRLATVYSASGVRIGSVVVGRGQADPYEQDSVAVDPAAHAAFFGNTSSTAVWQVDTRSLQVVRRIAVGAPVSSLSVDPATRRVYVGLDTGQELPATGVQVIDEARGRIVGRIGVEEDGALVVADPAAHLVVVAGPIDDRGDGAVQLLSTSE